MSFETSFKHISEMQRTAARD